MTNNRFAPPVAVVREVPEATAVPRPAQVAWAVRLLWASTVLSLPMFYREAMRAPSTGQMAVGLVVEVAFTAFGCYLYVCINRGRNWARIVTLVFTVLSTATAVFAPTVPSHTNVDQLYLLLNTVCDIVCMCLLFTPTASAWFRSRSAAPMPSPQLG